LKHKSNSHFEKDQDQISDNPLKKLNTGSPHFVSGLLDFNVGFSLGFQEKINLSETDIFFIKMLDKIKLISYIYILIGKIICQRPFNIGLG